MSCYTGHLTQELDKVFEKASEHICPRCVISVVASRVATLLARYPDMQLAEADLATIVSTLPEAVAHARMRLAENDGVGRPRGTA